jgi:hypothetical protein
MLKNLGMTAVKNYSGSARETQNTSPQRTQNARRFLEMKPQINADWREFTSLYDPC